MSAPLGFVQAIRQSVLVFDGAMGTELYRHHVFTNRSFDELCLSDPKLIRADPRRIPRRRGRRADDQHVRRQSRRAGQFGLAEKVREINRAGAKLAREVADAAERPIFVAGSIGPLPSQPQHEAADRGR